MSVVDLCRAAKEAKGKVAGLSTEKKNEVLRLAARYLEEKKDPILAANLEDWEAAKAAGMSAGLLDRLKLDEKRIGQIAEGIRQVADLPDPVGEELESYTLASGVSLQKIRVPLGVIGMIYESRPNVTADAFAICFKAGSAVVLKGGSDAIATNRAMTKVLKEALRDAGVTEDAVGLIDSTDRADTKTFLEQREYIDLLIPRGSAGLIRFAVENARVPVIETGSGNCHIFVDESADIPMALRIILNAKTQRTGVCNAAESLVVHEKILEKFLPEFHKAMREAGVELYADEQSLPFLEGAGTATEEDFAAEYLALKLSVKTVASVDEAIKHINRYHTKHSDCIVTENPKNAEKFLREVDSACVYVNASTRFTDGFEFGFGAEIGISTQMLHARGPMGLRELTSYKYLLRGHGETRK